MTRRTFGLSLGTTVLISLVCRLAYVVWQTSHESAVTQPMLDGAFYLDWARGLAKGAGEPAGAFYLAPLYPHLLAGFLAIAGERLGLLYAAQQALVVAAGCLLALRFADSLGRPAALVVASLLFLYHPSVFFASRPIGEPVALFTTALGVYLLGRSGLVFGALSGISFGLAALARPNLLLVVIALAAAELLARRWRRAAVVAAAVAVTLSPVAIRNYVASGSPVLVSSNGGMTLYHGNGPGALGIFTPAEGFSGTVAHQREEATYLARARTGRDLGPVDADRWWGREAIRTRVADPLGTLGLVGRRASLLLDNYEHSLDEAPALDGNPWRFAFPVPLAVLFGLATVGAVALGLAGSGGLAAWGPLLATAATPLMFYVSSRYRLPMAMFLCVPAGAGLAALVGTVRRAPARTRLVAAAALGLSVTVVSLATPSSALARTEEAAVHANRASAYADAKDLGRAEGEARNALALDPASIAARYNLAVVLATGGREEEAEALYRDTVTLDPSHAEAAGNLAKLLIERGSPAEAVPILERALRSRPGDAPCWTNLIVAWISLGDPTRARSALAEAQAVGVQLSPELIEAVGRGSDRVKPQGDTGR